MTIKRMGGRAAQSSAAGEARAPSAAVMAWASKRLAKAEDAAEQPVDKPRRGQASKWTLERQRAFLEALAGTCNVSLSLDHVGLSSASLYHMRKRSAAFRAAWDAALAEGYARLEAVLLDRALNGVRRTVQRGGELCEEVLPFSDTVALQLLSQHRKRVAETVAEQVTIVQIEEKRTKILDRLSDIIGRARDDRSLESGGNSDHIDHSHNGAQRNADAA